MLIRFLIAFAITVSSFFAVAAPSCRALFSLISQSTQKSSETINFSGFIHESSKRLQETNVQYSDLNSKQAASYTKGLVKTFHHYLYKSGESIKPRFTDPFSFIYTIKTERKISNDRYYAKILEFFDVFLKAESSKNLVSRISDWTKSPNDAAMVYDVLYQSRILEFHPEILTDLVSNNVFFKEAKLAKIGNSSSLVTYSFEKESNSISIVNYFRTSDYTEADWFKLSLEDRYKILQEKVPRSNNKNDQDAVWSVLPNSRTPEFMSRPFLEDSGSPQLRARWEVNHKLFTISVNDLHKNISDVNKMADKKNDSVHLHIVFSMQKTYKFFARFREWYKALSDYSIITSMEEGLHASSLTQTPSLKGEHPIVKKLENLSGWVQKFYTIGLRSGDVYSDNPESPLRRIGLELRDITYNMGLLKTITEKITEQIQTRAWEKKLSDGRDANTQVFRIEYNDKEDRALLSKYIHDQEAVIRLYKTDPNIVLALKEFEKESFFNYSSGTYKSATPEQISRIIEARNKYITSLKDLEREFNHFKKVDGYYDFDAFKAAIRWNLTDWAKQARISDLFSPF